MLVPTSFSLAYSVEQATAKELLTIAGNRLRQQVCGPNQWLFDDRVKSPESTFAKLLLGPVQHIAQMHDLYAATVVVPTQRELAMAIAAIQESLPASAVNRRRRGDPETFVYDDVHIIAELGDTAAGLPPGLTSRKFEIQVRTGLQYAWWRATHDVIYKGGRTWPLIRTASQVRGSLELLDTVLANLRETAQLQAAEADPVDLEHETIASLLDLWNEERRPENVAGFVTAAVELRQAANLSTAALVELVQTERGAELIAEERIPPLQAVLALIVEKHGAETVGRLKQRRFVLVTDELKAVSPVTADIDSARRVSLQ